jgi:hypothetical protein
MVHLQNNSDVTSSLFSSISGSIHEGCTEECSAIHRNLPLRIVQMILHSRLLTHLRYPRPYCIGNEANNHNESATFANSNKWFNLDMDDDPEIKGTIKEKLAEIEDFLMDIYLEWDEGTPIYIEPPKNPSELKPISISQNRILLENWTFSLSSTARAIDEGIDVYYKKMVVLIRGLHSLLRLLPSYRLCRTLKKDGSEGGLRISYSIRSKEFPPVEEHLPLAESILQEGISEVASTYSLPRLATCHGELEIEVNYRNNCKFQIKPTQPIIGNLVLRESAQREEPPKSCSFETIESHNLLSRNSPQLHYSIKKMSLEKSEEKHQEQLVGKASLPADLQQQSQPLPPVIPSSFHRSKSSTSSNDISIFVRQLEALKYIIEEDDLEGDEDLVIEGDIWIKYQTVRERIDGMNLEKNLPITPIKEEGRDEIQEEEANKRRTEDEEETLFPFHDEGENY